ncbi:MAG: AAA family ATPase [Methanobrevibacter sp.]|jgi:hypothetical protein|nr:AAA family ATPase [Methanobrevibacter sp.]
MQSEFLESPFQPGQPVSPEKFKGREKNKDKILRRLINVKNGNHQNFFIIGKKGMGKTSFVKYVGNLAKSEFQLIPVYINNDGSHTLNELITQIIEILSSEFDKETFKNKILRKFTNNIEELRIEGIGIKLREQNKEIIENIKESFPDFLINICEELEEENKGIFLIIDDINGLSDDEKFSSWYKSFSETLGFKGKKVPVAFTLVSYPETFDKLAIQNPSFTRIFDVVEINNLDDEDIKSFFIDTFNKASIHDIDPKGLEEMIYFSQGMPLVMQQIGDSIFWLIEGNEISHRNVLNGIIDAADEIGRKQIRPVLKSIRSDNYESILMKLGEKKAIKFKKGEFNKFLSSSEKNVFSDFLTRSKELGILESIGKDKSGEYMFTNMLYFVYFMIKSINNKTIRN